ncbi:membrane protein insertion efficiency factor YidD [Janthinobacterium sp. PC23-8]|uniref:membrane protein insertion efficiency factor YidD n=1 Tax=Janthinobacterium sp. PC23-8 TaxID=2012679 RepID=UPI0034E944A5
MRILFLWCIKVYRKFISPYKGFSCAHAYWGNQSCSIFGYRAVERHGASLGLLLIARRMKRCEVSHDRIRRLTETALFRGTRRQRGNCEVIGCVEVCAPEAIGPCMLDCATAISLKSCLPPSRKKP